VAADRSQLAHTPLFAGLSAARLSEIAAGMTPRLFERGEHLFRAGDPSDRMWVITGGLVHVIAAGGSRGSDVVGRLRRGDTCGEFGVIVGEPRAEGAVARTSTSAVELGGVEFAELASREPRILTNMIRLMRSYLTRAHEQAHSRRGEQVALAFADSVEALRLPLVSAATRASPKELTVLNRDLSFAGSVVTADQIASDGATVILNSDFDPASLSALAGEVDRVIVFVGSASETARLGELRRPARAHGDPIEVVLVGEEAATASQAWGADSSLRVIRCCQRAGDGQISATSLGWLARHITRTKLGLALGAGGAKGFAHLGVLDVLERAGYAIDYVSGSSIGAIVGTCIALGMDANAIDAVLRRVFDQATLAAIFKRSLGGATGFDLLAQRLHETTGDRTFDDTLIPLSVMAVDLSARAPAPLREGPLWQALLAATALAGVFRPYERDGSRFVDGMALVPVPTGAVLDDGADVTVAVNLISENRLDGWPGGAPPAPLSESRRRPGILDTLLEVMDLSQLDDSVRHAALADVVVSPLFGPCDWRDFHLADLFWAAGQRAAEAELPRLRALARPLA
jgi:predicted acylesterase/phospholipase RssA/CRP-like cAMP-binding protein